MSVEVTDTGAAVKLRSRITSTLDRLLGSWGATRIAKNEGRATIEAAKASQQVQVINAQTEARIKAIRVAGDAVAEQLAQRLREDPEFVERAIETSIVEDILVPQANREAVAQIALEDLRAPDSTGQEELGPESPDQLSAEFLSAIREFAGQASTEQARQLWADVLVREVKAPGTFNRKAMRIIDELDPSIAKLFQEICVARLGSEIPLALIPEIPFKERQALVGAQLLVNVPDLGMTLREMKQLPMVGQLGNILLLAICPAGVSPPVGLSKKFKYRGSAPSILCESLTDSGQAIASLFPADEILNATRLVDAMADHFRGYLVGAQETKIGSKPFYWSPKETMT